MKVLKSLYCRSIWVVVGSLMDSNPPADIKAATISIGTAQLLPTSAPNTRFPNIAAIRLVAARNPEAEDLERFHTVSISFHSENLELRLGLPDIKIMVVLILIQ